MNQEIVRKFSSILCDMKILTWFSGAESLYFKGSLPMVVYDIRYLDQPEYLE